MSPCSNESIDKFSSAIEKLCSNENWSKEWSDDLCQSIRQLTDISYANEGSRIDQGLAANENSVDRGDQTGQIKQQRQKILDRLADELEACCDALHYQIAKINSEDAPLNPITTMEQVEKSLVLSHKISYSVFAPPGYVMGQQLGLHQPPNPTDAQIRAGHVQRAAVADALLTKEKQAAEQKAVEQVNEMGAGQGMEDLEAGVDGAQAMEQGADAEAQEQPVAEQKPEDKPSGFGWDFALNQDLDMEFGDDDESSSAWDDGDDDDDSDDND